MTWHLEASCVGKTELFFPGQGNQTYEAAAALCADCPVLAECAADTVEYETDLPMVHGFRAGKDPEHRAQLLRARLQGTSGARKVKARQALAWQVEGKLTHEIADLLGMSKRNVARLVNDAKAELTEVKETFAA